MTSIVCQVKAKTDLDKEKVYSKRLKIRRTLQSQKSASTSDLNSKRLFFYRVRKGRQ